MIVLSCNITVIYEDNSPDIIFYKTTTRDIGNIQYIYNVAVKYTSQTLILLNFLKWTLPNFCFRDTTGTTYSVGKVCRSGNMAKWLMHWTSNLSITIHMNSKVV